MQNYARIGIFGILALLALRVGIGWHFFMEGTAKVKAGNFSSEGFLTSAQGPLADNFKALIWDQDYQLRLSQDKMNGLFEQAATQVSDHFGFTEQQNKELEKLKSAYSGLDKKGQVYVGKLNEVFDEYSEEIYKYWESVDRLEKMKESETWNDVASLRGQKEQIENERMADVKPAIESIDVLWKRYERELNAISTDPQRSQGYFRFARPGEGEMNTAVVDRIVPIFDMVVGILLIIGLLTPLASVAAALFLLGVVLTQMPGYPGTAPTYFQAVEALACLVLAGTDAGRYAGLDFIPWAWWHKRKKAKAAAT